MIKFISNYLVNTSIRRKFFLGYLIAAIIPMTILTLYSYNNTKRNLIEQNYSNMQSSLLQIDNNIEKKLADLSRSSSLIYLNKDLQDYLNRDYTNSGMEDAYNYINKFFNDILILNPDITLTTIYTANMTIPADEYYIKHIDANIKSEKWYEHVKDSTGNVVYGSTFNNSNGIYVFTLARYLNNSNINNQNGILVLTIEESELYSLIEKSSSNSFNFIVDQDGGIVSCRDKTLITENIFQTLNINKSKLSGKGKLDVNYKNQKMLLVYSTLNNGWKTLTMVPYTSFLSNAQKSASYVLIIFLSSILLVIFLVYAFSNVLTKRINILAGQVSNVQEGNFNFEIEHMGNDEIGKLSIAFDNMNKKLRFLIEEVYQKELLKKQAELNVLQEQINPHFLYNTLASISYLSLRNNDKGVTEMASLLSKFYRMSLNNGNYMLPISSEIELTKYYIEIQKRRFKDLLNITFFIDESLINYKTLKLILQPFIENSINHGIWDDENGINIVIKLHKEENKIIFEVIDDGIGMSSSKLDELINDISNVSSGYGIRNVNNRIKLYFGDDFGVHIYSKIGIGTQVKIIIPFKE